MPAYDDHYQGDVEPIELMQAQMTREAFMGFLRGNIIKYASRFGKKIMRAPLRKQLRFLCMLHGWKQQLKVMW